MPQKRPIQERFNLFERILLNTPTWLAITGVVIPLAITTVWLNVNFENDWSISKIALESFKAVFENLESIAIVSAVILYFKESPDRKDQKHYEAWQVIDTAAAGGQPTSYARIKALEDLNRDNVSLQSLDVPGADLSGINLRSSDLRDATLIEVDLKGAYLKRADLGRANLSGADLRGANLVGANLRSANLNGANLGFAEVAELRGTKLSTGRFRGTKGIKTAFTRPDLRSIKIFHSAPDPNIQIATDLHRANLRNADLRNANLRGANFGKAGKNRLSPERVEELKERGAIFEG